MKDLGWQELCISILVKNFQNGEKYMPLKINSHYFLEKLLTEMGKTLSGL